MSIEACPTPSEDCPYFDRRPPGKLKRTQHHGCYSDMDHIVPRRLAKRKGSTPLERQYVAHPVNHQQLCRWEHDEKTWAGDEPMPTREEMLGAMALYKAEEAQEG